MGGQIPAGRSWSARMLDFENYSVLRGSSEAPGGPSQACQTGGSAGGSVGDPGGSGGIRPRFGGDSGRPVCTGTHKTRLRRPSAGSPGAGTISPNIILLGDHPARKGVFLEFYMGQSALDFYKTRAPASGAESFFTGAHGLRSIEF